MLSCLHGPVVKDKLEVQVSRRQDFGVKQQINQVLHSMQRARINTSERTLCFSSKETVAGLAAVSQSHSSGAVWERILRFMSSFYNNFL